MARKKGSLPPYVWKLISMGYRLKPYLGRVNGKTKWGKTINLAPPDAPMSEVWRAYEEAVGDDRQTVGWLLGLYKDSDRFGELSRQVSEGICQRHREAHRSPCGQR